MREVSRQGRYHNKKFKELGEELGLIITEDGTIGWSGTELGPDAEQRYAEQLRQLAAAMTAYRREEVPGAPKAKDYNNLVALCACPRKVRVSRSVLAQAPILCGACEREFTAKDTGELDED